VKQKHVITADGSSSIYLEDLDEHYHSSHGAMQEAKHVFIQNGIDFIDDKDRIRVFEMGFGTGLNALLTALSAEEKNVQISYTGIEAYPVQEELIGKLNYTNHLSDIAENIFKDIHGVLWNRFRPITPNFHLNKVDKKIEDYEGQKGEFDLVYFDAFGHRAQPEMWDKNIIEKISNLLDSGGVFVTYAARGQLRRDLTGLGFEVEKLPGPPGKREMIRAIKK
jgi:tRNA U34 5-methylaminomethyl-2-thiouridine-forming methyltransferase MnmC